MNPADVFAMGNILKPIGELGARTGCTIVIAHHTKKRGPQQRYEPTDLEDLTMSGFAEWARQWVLLGRRCEYANDGHHELWLNVGGSAGHSGCYVLSVDEGVTNDDGDGRFWSTRVENASTFIERSRELAEKRKEEKALSRRLAKLEALNETLKRFPDGETKNSLRRETRPQPSPQEFDDLMAELIEREAAKPCEIMKNKRTEDGFKPIPLPPASSVGDGQ